MSALNVLCAQLMRNLFAIDKFLFIVSFVIFVIYFTIFVVNKDNY